MPAWRSSRLVRLAFGLFALLACSQADVPPATTPSGVTATPTVPLAGGPAIPPLPIEKIAVAINNAPPSLEPTAGVVSWHLLQLGLAETLTRVTRSGAVEPWLAQTVRQIGEREWEITLRDNLRFFDGKVVDANAVKRSLERTLAKNPASSVLLDAESIAVTGPRTLVIWTKGSSPALASTLAYYGLVIHDAERGDAQPDAFATAPSFTGPFVPSDFRKDAGLKLSRNTVYWGDVAKVTEIDVRFVVDANTRTSALLAGEVDLAYQLPQEAVAAVERQRGRLVKSVTTSYQYFVILNLAKPQFADKAVRQALSRAVDRQALAQKVLLGGAEPAKAAFSPVLPFALDAGYGYEPDRARAALDAAGWRPGADGIRAKAGVRLALTLLTYPQRPELGQIGVALQAQLKDAGVAVELRQVDQINDALKDPSFDAALYATNTAPTGDPGVFLNQYYRTGGTSNWGKLSAPMIDELIARLNATPDPAQRAQLARQIQQAGLEEASQIYLVVPKFRIGLSERLKDYEPFPSDYYVLDNQIRVSR